MPNLLHLTLPVALLALSPLPTLAQAVSQYGQPITDAPSEDLTCYMETRDGHTLDLAKLCGGNPQQVRTVATAQTGLVFSSIEFETPTDAERQVRKIGLWVKGTLTNRSTQPIRARVIDYNISAFNGRRWETLVRTSEFISDDFDIVLLEPGQSISFAHKLNFAQARQFRGYMMFPDNFRFEATGSRNDVIELDP